MPPQTLKVSETFRVYCVGRIVNPPYFIGHPPADSMASSTSFIKRIVTPGAMVIFQTLKVTLPDSRSGLQDSLACHNEDSRRKPLESGQRPLLALASLRSDDAHITPES